MIKYKNKQSIYTLITEKSQSYIRCFNIDICFPVYETPSYKAKLEVSYVTTDSLASNCKAGFQNMLVTYNTTIAKAIDEKCKDLNPGNFAIRSFTTTTLSFKVL